MFLNTMGIEPTTTRLKAWRSTNLSYVSFATLSGVFFFCLSSFFFYTLEDLKWHASCQNQQGLLISRRVNFGFGNSSKNPEVLDKVDMKILTHLPFYKTEDLPLQE